jgi:hypothetical protein
MAINFQNYTFFNPLIISSLKLFYYLLVTDFYKTQTYMHFKLNFYNYLCLLILILN